MGAYLYSHRAAAAPRAKEAAPQTAPAETTSAHAASLIQMRQALDRSQGVQSTLALQRALSRQDEMAKPAEKKPAEKKPVVAEAAKPADAKPQREKPALQKKGIAINDDAGLEREADVLGAKALAAQPLQRKLDAKNDATADRWDAICDAIEVWRTGRNGTLEAWIAEEEPKWTRQARQPSWKERKVDAFKHVVVTAADNDKKPLTDSAALDWDDITGYLQGLAALNLVTIAIQNDVKLTGGHGIGTTWTATNAITNDEIQTGSVPKSTHGLQDNALNGARGSVRTVIVAHNGQLDAIKADVKNL